MSDEQRNNPNQTSFDEKYIQDEETTQTVPSVSDANDNDKSEEKFASNPVSRRKKSNNPANDTNVFSRNNPILRRILNNQNNENDNTISLADKQEVILLIRGMIERIVMEQGKTYKLGRYELGASAEDEIDLTPYGAQDRGVSRIHAQMHIEDGLIHLTDLSSTNGTYVNSTKLEPDTPTPLKKGDELLLGRLTMQFLIR